MTRVCEAAVSSKVHGSRSGFASPWVRKTGAVDADDPVRHQVVDAGLGGREVGDHVTDLEVRDRDALLEDDGAEVEVPSMEPPVMT